MLETIETALLEQCGLKKDRPIVAGVSGGPDSLCLMGVLRKAGFRIIVAHFNHKLRPDSDSDANVVEQTAARLNLASVIESGRAHQGLTTPIRLCSLAETHATGCK